MLLIGSEWIMNVGSSCCCSCFKTLQQMTSTRFSEEHFYFTVYYFFYAPLISTATKYCYKDCFLLARTVYSYFFALVFVSSVELCVFNAIRTVSNLDDDSIHANARFLPHGSLQE